MLSQIRSGELKVETVTSMGSSYESDTLILFRLLGFAVNSFDGLPQLGAVGPVVYALNEFSLLSFCDPM